MPLDYFAPGVYVEEVDRGARPIAGVSLSVAGFIGFTEAIRGDAELFKPMMITNWSQFLEYFGKPDSEHPGFTDFDAYLPFAVRGWFDNGGGRCWVASIGTLEPGAAKPALEDTGTKLLTAGSRPALQFNLRNEDDTEIVVEISDSSPKPPAAGDEPPLDTGEYFKVTLKQAGNILEVDGAPCVFEHLTMDDAASGTVADYVVAVLNEEDNNPYVQATDLSGPGRPLAQRPANGAYPVEGPPPFIEQVSQLTRGIHGSRADRKGLQGIFEIDDIAMIACPDLMWAFEQALLDIDQVHGVMEAMLSYCENSFPGPPFRMAVLDPPPIKNGEVVSPAAQKPQHVDEWLTSFNRRSMFGAVYYPWIKVPNPANAGKPILVPPCGHMMGIWCRTDQDRGVFKAPANETPRGVIGLAYETNMREQELLNPKGINCIRNFSSYNRGFKVWGARTLVEPDNIQWRYISVRRLLSYIEKSIEMGTQWVVFEPNDPDLWARVSRSVSSFLEGLWRDGALFGGSPAEAFYVKCDGELNTQDTIMKGRLYVEVGVCPVRPAEFVIFRISQWAPNQ
ncbi:phage tail sheath C-terminal domain-containing protein [Synechococcus sp. PCC 7336]|uniref:phage tail sheath family protein n=1 Tax=Synechococcus sp. PCC 7336 TaxID=195250 RepID=UPI0003459421|nr:phage tail sheath C-terminal domain-containing protein [Synechococcus sp. PCC 7336]